MAKRARVYMLKSDDRHHPVGGWAFEGAANAWFEVGPETATVYRTRKEAEEARARLRVSEGLRTEIVRFEEVGR